MKGKPDSGTQEMFAFGIENQANFCCGIQNPSSTDKIPGIQDTWRGFQNPGLSLGFPFMNGADT